MSQPKSSLTRKQRRAANGNAQPTPPNPSGMTFTDLKAEDIPMSQPDRSGPKAPTLYELAAERQAALADKAEQINAARRRQRNQTSQSITATSRVTELNGDEDDKNTSKAAESANLDSPLATALLFGVTLAVLNLTLDILVWHQYAQELPHKLLISRALKTSLPLYTTLVYMFHSPRFGLAKVEALRQFLMFAGAVASGCYAVWISSEGQYLAVTKKAPPAGTVWVWCVLEMGLVGGVGSLAVVAAWTWWYGYNVI